MAREFRGCFCCRKKHAGRERERERGHIRRVPKEGSKFWQQSRLCSVVSRYAVIVLGFNRGVFHHDLGIMVFINNRPRCKPLNSTILIMVGVLI